jgi:CRISPR/Cas system-associated protein endoribonuclease Cas2
VTRSPFGIIAVVLVAVVCCIAPALAQEPATPAQDKDSSGGHGFGVQVLGGPLFANYQDVTGLEFDRRTGYLVGLAFGGNRRGVVGVEADVLYGSKPVEIVGQGTLKQSVVHVPVMLKVNLGQASANGFRAFLLGGGYIEWQFNGKLQNVDLSADTSGFEAGYTVGGGFEVLRLSVQARYVRGVRGIDKTFDLSQTTETKSNCFLLLVGIRLN